MTSWIGGAKVEADGGVGARAGVGAGGTGTPVVSRDASFASVRRSIRSRTVCISGAIAGVGRFARPAVAARVYATCNLVHLALVQDPFQKSEHQAWSGTGMEATAAADTFLATCRCGQGSLEQVPYNQNA